MKIFSKLDKWAEEKADAWGNRMELAKWNKLIRKACKKYWIKNRVFLEMYKSIQKDVLKEVNAKSIEAIEDKENFKHIPFNIIVKQRIYDLNREFVFLANGEFHNSLYALTRQMVELYIRLIQCRSDKTIITKLIDEERQKLPIKEAIKNLKGKIKFPYLKDTDADKFLDSALAWFNHFSNLYHISGISLSQNMWVSKKDEVLTRLYIEKPKLEEGDKLLIFSKRAVVSDEQYKILIHQFYTFTGLSIREIKLLETIS